MRRIIYVALILFSLALRSTAAESITLSLKDILPPAFVDTEAQLIHPGFMAGWLAAGVHMYDQPGLGYSIRYAKDASQRLTLYVYDMNLPTIPNGPDNRFVKEQNRATVDRRRRLQTEDRYEKVSTLKKSVTPRSWGDIRFSKATYEFIQPDLRSEKHSGKCRSESYITGYKNHFVKIRFTYDRETKCSAEEFIKALVQLMETDHSEQTVMLAAIELFNDRPLSTEGQAAAHSFMTYAIDTDDFTIMIHDSLMPWMEQSDELENSNLLLSAYFAGGVEHILTNHLDKGGEPGSFFNVIHMYEQLREDDEIQEIPEIEAWLKEKDKKALLKRLTTDPTAGLEPDPEDNPMDL